MDWALIAAVVATIAATFKLMDYFVSETENSLIKQHLFAWKKNLTEYSIADITHIAGQNISDLFDGIFGKKHWSLRCFIFSSLSSLLAIFICYALFILYWGIGPEIKDVDYYNDWIIWIAANLIVDYLSLIETRYLLTKIKNKATLQVLLLSIVDIILSASIYIILIVLLYTKIFPVFMGSFEFSDILPAIESEFHTMIQTVSPDIDLTDKDVLESLENKDLPGKSYFAIFSWSTFFTSFIFQVYVLSYLALKILGPFRKRIIVLLLNLGESTRAVTAFGVFLASVSGVLLSLLKLA